MEKTILDLLKTKFVGVSENILNRMATKLAKTATTEEAAKTSVDGLTIQMVIDSYTDSRVTEASQTAVKNYETKHGLKDGKAIQKPVEVTPPTPNPTPSEDMPAWAKALIDSNKAISDRLNRYETEKVTTSRKAQLDNAIANLPEPMKKAYSRISLDSMSDEDFTTFMGEVSTEVQGIVDSNNAKGGAFGKPTPPQGNPNGAQQASTEEVDDVVAKLKV